jgi:hypothetical protein
VPDTQEGATYSNRREGGLTPKTVWAYEDTNTIPLPGTEQFLTHLVIFNHASLPTEIIVAFQFM